MTEFEILDENGDKVENPLRHYRIPIRLSENDGAGNGKIAYDKYAGYETVRYPFSGLVATQEQISLTTKQYIEYKGKGDEFLNKNFITASKPQDG